MTHVCLKNSKLAISILVGINGVQGEYTIHVPALYLRMETPRERETCHLKDWLGRETTPSLYSLRFQNEISIPSERDKAVLHMLSQGGRRRTERLVGKENNVSAIKAKYTQSLAMCGGISSLVYITCLLQESFESGRWGV